MTSFYNIDEINILGFKSVGINAKISKNAKFYGESRITIGDNVRIDDFCVLSAGSGGINIGNYVHIAIYTSLQGEGNITLQDFSSISSKVSIYSSNDDYSGDYMTNPTIPTIYTNVKHSDVMICKHVIIGCGAIILPGVTLNIGVAIGALSLVYDNCEKFYIYKGNPATKLIKRNIILLDLEQKFKNKQII